MIKAENISKRYGAHLALDGLSFEIEKGEICGFLGPNGAGKTTMMRILTGYMPPTSGKVSVAGFDTGVTPIEVKKRVGYLPETTPLYPDMRVVEYLDFVAELKGITSRDERRRKVGEAMEATMIGQRSRYLIRALSKGYRQRVGLAQALIGEPEVLVLDEPTIGLDPKQIVEIRSLIKDLAGKRTVILSSHILPEVQMICSRVLIINKGRLVASGTMSGLSTGAEAGIVVKISGDQEAAAGDIASIPGVDGVLRAGMVDDVTEYKIRLAPAAQTAETRRNLVKLAAKGRWDLVELARTGVSLEETYIRLISGEEPAQPPAFQSAAPPPPAGGPDMGVGYLGYGSQFKGPGPVDGAEAGEGDA